MLLVPAAGQSQRFLSNFLLNPTEAHTCAQLHVKGRDKIFGVFNFWAALQRDVRLKVVRVGEGRETTPTIHLSRLAVVWSTLALRV
jgi:hypothetical protein